MTNKIKLRSAFSLLELSIVIAIIGLLVFGLFQGGELIRKSRVKSAAAMTKSSVVSKTDGLLAWFETTMPNSFSNAEAADGIAVNTWYNLGNPSTTLNNAAAGSAPTYTSNAINGLPVLRFNGSSNYLAYDGTGLANSDYTIFVVEQRRVTNTLRNLFLGGGDASAGANLSLGYTESGFGNYYMFDQYNNAHIAPVAAYSSPIPRILTFRSSVIISGTGSIDGKDFYVNGILASPFTCLSTCTTTNLTSYNGANIGRYYDGSYKYYNGDIGEIIIFNRYLNNQERSDIESYLGKKWGITTP